MDASLPKITRYKLSIDYPPQKDLTKDDVANWIVFNDTGMKPNDKGTWVKYSDYQALSEYFTKAIEVLTEYKTSLDQATKGWEKSQNQVEDCLNLFRQLGIDPRKGK